MAASNLSVSPRSAFPQVFTRSIDRFTRSILDRPKLGVCCYSGPGFDCNQPAIVHDLASEMEYCAKHFQRIARAR